MRIMLTGSTGFVGSRVLHHMQQLGHLVSVVPSEMLKGEITDERFNSLSCFTEGKAPDVIIHMAAISSTAYSEKYPEESYLANVALPQVMARLANINNCKLISCSSDQVYNGCTGKGAYKEDEKLNPINVYGRHKLQAEELVLGICPSAVLLRLTWMYDMPNYQTNTNNNFLTGLLKNAMVGKPSKYSNCDYRGITYVHSVAEQLPETFNLDGGIYNYGSENEKNMYELSCEFMTLIGMGERIEELISVSDSAQLRNLRMDCSKIRKKGIEIESSVDGIVKLISDYPVLFN